MPQSSSDTAPAPAGRRKLAVIGLGYVGLPLAAAFGAVRPTVGFDVNERRIGELKDGWDRTGELGACDFARACQLRISSCETDLADCTIFVVAVPTPIDKTRSPDLSALKAASLTVGRAIKPGDVVIYESTVYPGATEDDCVPLIEQTSGLRFNEDFFVGYSPERANPGDRNHRLTDIVKITAGSTPQTADLVDDLYREIVSAGTHRAASIKVAEAAKVIENIQRDVNIALINECAMIFNRLGIDTEDVLQAAGTKWNFAPFRPGLVGGHCIGVDPYYLTHKAQMVGHNPEIILSGRRLNDGMAAYVAARMCKSMTQRGIAVNGANILVLGLTFKENCPDLRNTKVADLVSELQDFQAQVDVYDPHVDPADARRDYGIDPVGELKAGAYDGVVLAVAHNEFRAMTSLQIDELCKTERVIYDLKHAWPRDVVTMRL